MVELPSPPSLDPDGTPEKEGSSEPAPAAVPAPAAAPASAAVPASARATPPAPPPDEPVAMEEMPTQPSTSAVKAVPAPIAPPDDTSIGVQDSVEEVLQQTSAQTLQLSHLEDILTALNQTLTDFQEEMHAGFVEMRAVTESVISGESTRRTEVPGGESLTQRIEFVEEQAVETNKRQGLITILAIAQGVLLIIVLVAVLVGMRSGPTTEIPQANYTTSSQSSNAQVEVKKPPPVEDTRKKKRRRKR